MTLAGIVMTWYRKYGKSHIYLEQNLNIPGMVFIRNSSSIRVLIFILLVSK